MSIDHRKELSGRVAALDIIASVLPMDRRDELAEILTDQDIETLRHLVNEGMGANSLRALTSDLAYLQAWSLAATGAALPWPAPEALLLKFVAHHLFDPLEQERDSSHGMPHEIALELSTRGLLKVDGPHAPSTVRRRLTSWSVLTRWRGLQGAFSSSSLKAALRLAVRANGRPRQRKSKGAVTADVLALLLATCDGNRPVDVRDRAILSTAFASGGRRRSEIANLRVEDLSEEDPVEVDPDTPPLACIAIRLGRTKTTSADDEATAFLVGKPVETLKHWLQLARIEGGPVFRKIDQWGNIDSRALTPQSINFILKSRCEKAGLDPQAFSAHGLRSGYLTEAANRGIPLQEAMQQSQHKSVSQASRYYNDAGRRSGRAARLLQ